MQNPLPPCPALAPQPCSALVAALTAGSEHCARLIRERPAAPMQPTWALLRDLLNDMRYAAEPLALAHREEITFMDKNENPQKGSDALPPCPVLPAAACSADSEPEECIAQAMYLLQLCQQDINIGRKSTIWPRAKRAREACQTLEDMFSPNAIGEARAESATPKQNQTL